MKYIINLVIFFDPDLRTLSLNNDSQTAIELSKPSCRVFIALIKKNGTNLTRDELLKSAWEDFGFYASNASLNNCISEIRKAFINLSMEEKIIITVQKVGFKLNANIQSVTKKNDIKSIQNTPKLKEEEINLSKITQPIKEKKGSPLINFLNLVKKKCILSTFIVFFIVAITIVIGVWFKQSNQLNLIGIYEKCNIYSVDIGEMPPDFALRAKQMLKKTSIDCTQQQQDIFYIERRRNNEKLKVKLLAACIKLTNGKYQSCNNLKIVE